MTLTSAFLSRIPGIRHGFDSPFDLPPEGLLHCKQVHGDTITSVIAQSSDELSSTHADGLMTAQIRIIGVQTADCLPALFASRDSGHIAAVHAGWRGLAKGILPRAVEHFDALGVSPAELVVALGPAIGPCCFEVGSDIIEKFERDWGKLWPGKDRPWHQTQPRRSSCGRSQAPVSFNNLWIDLKHIARLQLSEAGVPTTCIEDVGLCTYCGPHEFASHRRATHDGTKASRQWAWIGKVTDACPTGPARSAG